MCRDYFSPRVNFLWVLCEIAIAACDLAELPRVAIAATPVWYSLGLGVCITTLDVLVLLFLQSKGFRYVEALVITSSNGRNLFQANSFNLI